MTKDALVSLFGLFLGTLFLSANLRVWPYRKYESKHERSQFASEDVTNHSERWKMLIVFLVVDNFASILERYCEVSANTWAF